MEKDILFEFNVAKGRKSIALFIFLSLSIIFLIFFTENKISNNFHKHIEISIFLLLSYIILLLILFSRVLKSYFTSSLKIQCADGQFILPNFYLGKKVVSISDIYSVEPISLGGKVLGLMLGVSKNRIFVDKQCFHIPEDFEVFNRLISVEVDKRSGGDEKLVIKKCLFPIKKNKSSDHPFIYSFLSHLFFVYYRKI
jgi:hypothetical protein